MNGKQGIDPLECRCNYLLNFFPRGALNLPGEVIALPSVLSEGPQLMLTINSVRRAAWYTKLGVARYSDLTVPLASVLPGGGVIPSLKLVVARRYPILFLEKNADGSKAVLSEEEREESDVKFADKCQVCDDFYFLNN